MKMYKLYRESFGENGYKQELMGKFVSLEFAHKAAEKYSHYEYDCCDWAGTTVYMGSEKVEKWFSAGYLQRKNADEWQDYYEYESWDENGIEYYSFQLWK